MTDYEILSLVITMIGLLIGVISLLLKAFEYLDSRSEVKNYTSEATVFADRAFL